jgi:hypothetical protein
MIEIDCQDCGLHCTIFGAEAGAKMTRCATCQFIRDFSAPEEQEAVRARLYDEESMQYWREIGCYRDDTSPERACDHCQRPYRGPAVYCSLTCALADA